MTTKIKQLEGNNVPKLRFPDFFSEWEKKKLGDFFEITSSKRVFQHEWTNIGVPFYRTREIVRLSENGYVDNELFISTEMYEDYKQRYGVPQENDILVTGVGTIGKIYVVSKDERFYFKDGNIIWFKTLNQINSFFTKYLFETKSVKKQILDNASITTVGTFTIDGAKKTKVVVPSLLEQKKIVDFLTSVDNLIENLKKQKENLENYKKGMMQKIFSQEIRFKDENGSDFLDWEEKKLGDLFNFLSTNSFSRDCLNYDGGKVKNIHYGDIHTKFKSSFDIEKENVPYINNTIGFSQIKDESYCQEGDLVIADASEDYKDIGKTIELLNLKDQKVVAGLHTFLLRKKNQTELATGFPGYLMKIDFVRKQIMKSATGISVLGISKGNISNIKLEIPSASEQQKIANSLILFDNLIELKKQKVIQAEQWKKGLMQQLFV